MSSGLQDDTSSLPARPSLSSTPRTTFGGKSGLAGVLEIECRAGSMQQSGELSRKGMLRDLNMAGSNSHVRSGCVVVGCGEAVTLTDQNDGLQPIN